MYMYMYSIPWHDLKMGSRKLSITIFIYSFITNK